MRLGSMSGHVIAAPAQAVVPVAGGGARIWAGPGRARGERAGAIGERVVGGDLEAAGDDRVLVEAGAARGGGLDLYGDARGGGGGEAGRCARRGGRGLAAGAGEGG